MSAASAVTPEVVVFDLDGVLRHFDRDAERELEARHGLEHGALLDAAFGDELGLRLVTGEIDWPEFADGLAARIGRPATDEFLAMRAVLDHAAVQLVHDIRAAGRPVALLTNGTLRTEEELVEHGIAQVFDRVFNAARIGVAKPDPLVYEVVTAELGVAPAGIAFIDDVGANVTAARSAGWSAHHYQGLDEARAWLCGLGLPLG